MKKAAAVSLLTVALLLVTALPGDAGDRRWRHHHPGWRPHHHFRSHVVIGVGPSIWWYPYWYYPPPYYVYPPPPVVVEEPPVYVQQTVPGYWYYCPSAKAYYPNVQTCPESWIKVPPRPE